MISSVNSKRPPKRPLVRLLPKTLFLCLLILGTLPNCGASGRAKSDDTGFERRDFILEKAGGARVPIKLEIARTETERKQGLMNRPSLPEGEGMLFVFESEQILSFWMKNTLIPLSIAFIRTDGRIIEIRDMQALDVSTVRSSRSARYALEVPQGWFSRAGIESGDHLLLDGL
jgi:uncharacterized membrane protein (UPF0127 family)